MDGGGQAKTRAQRHPFIPGPWDPPASFLSHLSSVPLPQISKGRQRGQWNSHQRPWTHGKEIRALGTLLPGGSEASPPAWLLFRVGVWGVLPLVSSYVKCQTAGGQPEQSWPSGPHLGRVCTHTNWGVGGQQRILVCVLGQGHSQAVTICCPVKRPGQGLAPLRSKLSTFPGLLGFAELLAIIGPSFSVPTNRDSALPSYGGWGQDSPKVVAVVKSSVTQPMLAALLPAPALVLVALLGISVTESPGPGSKAQPTCPCPDCHSVQSNFILPPPPGSLLSWQPTEVPPVSHIWRHTANPFLLWLFEPCRVARRQLGPHIQAVSSHGNTYSNVVPQEYYVTGRVLPCHPARDAICSQTLHFVPTASNPTLSKKQPPATGNYLYLNPLKRNKTTMCSTTALATFQALSSHV